MFEAKRCIGRTFEDASKLECAKGWFPKFASGTSGNVCFDGEHDRGAVAAEMYLSIGILSVCVCVCQ